MPFYPCQNCKEPVEMTISRRKKSKYIFCSKRCRQTPCFQKTCDVCGALFKTTVYHLHGARQARYCSHDCFLAMQRTRHTQGEYKTVIQKCEHCGQKYEVRANYKGKQRFCSQTCAMTYHARSGPDNHKWKPKAKVSCDYCGKVFETYPSRIGRKKYCCKTHGMLARFTSKKRTDIEREMASALSRAGIAYSEQVPMYDKWVVDFLLPDCGIIIECDGTYWHDRPGAKARDKGKDRYLAKCGYRVLRFTDKQIYADVDTCVAQVRKHL